MNCASRLSAWKVLPLSECGTLLTGNTPSRSESRFWGGSIPWISAKALKGFEVHDSDERLTDLGASEASTVPAGSVLFVVRGMSLAKEFRVGITSRAVAFNQDLRALVPRDGVDGRYLAYYLKASEQRVLELVDEASHGTKRLTSDRFERIDVPIPPLDEQRRIAEVLDRVEGLRARRRATLSLLDALQQALFLDLFGDATENPKGWPRIPLGNLITAGPQNGLYKPASEYGSGTPILRIDAFYDGAITKLATLKRVRVSSEEVVKYGLCPDDIVINRVNSLEYLGKSAIVPELSEPTVFESNMMRFAVDRSRVDPVYLIHFLQTPFVRSQVQSAAKKAVNQASINQQDVRGILVNLPPIALQRELRARVKAMDSLRTSVIHSLDRTDALVASLRHRAFRGEL